MLLNICTGQSQCAFLKSLSAVFFVFSLIDKFSCRKNIQQVSRRTMTQLSFSISQYSMNLWKMLFTTCHLKRSHNFWPLNCNTLFMKSHKISPKLPLFMLFPMIQELPSLTKSRSRILSIAQAKLFKNSCARNTVKLSSLHAALFVSSSLSSNWNHQQHQ